MSRIDLDLLPDAVVVVDAAGRLTGLNRAALDLLGDDAAGLVGSLAAEAFEIRGPGGALAFDEVITGFEGQRELVFRRPDGTTVHAQVTAKVDGGAAVLALRPSDEKSGIAIISTVAHELRSPLTSVKGYTSLMLNRWDRLAEEQKRMMLEQVHHDADRVTRLVTELLDISRLETGRLVLRRQIVDLSGMAASVLDKVRFTVPALDCTINFPDEFPRVYADPDKIEQVLTNLVENAAKYGSTDGMRVTGTLEGGFVVVSVSDTGPGIPIEDLPHVFTKFFRRDHGKPTGTGLGLWISRGLVEAHGGELTVRSEPGAGSTFRFTLPTDAWEREVGEALA
jgi:signal transduction histidine kinase